MLVTAWAGGGGGGGGILSMLLGGGGIFSVLAVGAGKGGGAGKGAAVGKRMLAVVATSWLWTPPTRKTNHSGIFLSSQVPFTDVSDPTRYPSAKRIPYVHGVG